MPISRENFERGFGQEVTLVLEFLRDNSGEAYTSEELESGVDVDDIDDILELLCDNGLVKSKEVYSSQTVSETYYIIADV